jgi:hypothetical protein
MLDPGCQMLRHVRRGLLCGSSFSHPSFKKPLPLRPPLIRCSVLFLPASTVRRFNPLTLQQSLASRLFVPRFNPSTLQPLYAHFSFSLRRPISYNPAVPRRSLVVPIDQGRQPGLKMWENRLSGRRLAVVSSELQRPEAT